MRFLRILVLSTMLASACLSRNLQTVSTTSSSTAPSSAESSFDEQVQKALLASGTSTSQLDILVDIEPDLIE
jgi:hypothetical protein